MSNTLNPLENNPSWQMTGVMNDICEPLFTRLKINYVDYARYYPDGRVVSLFSDRDYVSSFASDLVTSNTPNKMIGPGMHLWGEYINTDFLHTAAKQFHHTHGITVLTEMKEYSEIFNMAAAPENTRILGFYLNHQAVLQQVIQFVRKKALKLLNKLEDSPLILPSRKIDIAMPEPVDKKLLDILTEGNCYQVQVNHIPIDLSRREAQCLHFLHQGKSAKEMAKMLSISHRTVEVYLDQIRQKTASKSRLEVISKIQKNQLESLAIAIEE